MSRGVSPITTVRSRGQSPARARAIARQLGARRVVGAEAALAGLEVVRRSRRAPSLSRAIGSRLPVTSDEPELVRPRRERLEQLGDAGRDAVREVRPGTARA